MTLKGQKRVDHAFFVAASITDYRLQFLTVSPVQELRCRLAFRDLVSGIPRFRNRQRIFSGIVELAYVSAPLTHTFANRAIWHGNYPIVRTMSVYVVGELGLVVRRWDDASIYPIFRRFERYV